MVKVTAATSFLGNEGMWRPGDTKEVSNDRAHELLMLGHVIEAADQSGVDIHAGPSAATSTDVPNMTLAGMKPKVESPLQGVADAVGATVVETDTASLDAAAEVLGATVGDKPEVPGVLSVEGEKEEKGAAKRTTKEEKAAAKTKEAK